MILRRARGHSLFLFSLLVPARTKSATAMASISYPVSKQGDEVTELHGKVIPDPYRWLEDPE